MAKKTNLTKLAEEEMSKESPELACDYSKIIAFLEEHPEFSSQKQWRSGIDENYVKKNVKKFEKSRVSRHPKTPTTKPDPAVRQILSSYYSIPDAELDKAVDHHFKAMGAENATGDLLEAYLASKMSNTKWTWCSGSLIRAVDFIRPLDNSNWSLLQVKNRDNSENSSSSAIRDGASIDIVKWHRSISKTGETNWENFPDEELKNNVSEKDFQTFIKTSLKNTLK